MTSRRSFLALVAGALSVKPDVLLGADRVEIPQPRPVALPEALNRPLEDWWNQWAIQDAVTIAPQRAVDEILFSSPIPDNFALRGINWAMESSIPLRDMSALLESLRITLECDGREYFKGPVSWFPMGGSAHEIWPQIIPRKSVNLIVRADPCDLTLPTTVHFQLSGICRMPEVA